MATLTSPKTITRRPKPSLQPLLIHLQSPLAPLRPVPSGTPHPDFPKAILNFHLLTEAQLDSIARYYHQDPDSPTILTFCYPECMDWDREFLTYIGETWGVEARVGAKRRKFGKFIGLRGCETPVEEVMEKEQWAERRARLAIKAGSMGFLGRQGFGQW